MISTSEQLFLESPVLFRPASPQAPGIFEHPAHSQGPENPDLDPDLPFDFAAPGGYSWDVLLYDDDDEEDEVEDDDLFDDDDDKLDDADEDFEEDDDFLDDDEEEYEPGEDDEEDEL